MDELNVKDRVAKLESDVNWYKILLKKVTADAEKDRKNLHRHIETVYPHFAAMHQRQAERIDKVRRGLFQQCLAAMGVLWLIQLLREWIF